MLESTGNESGEGVTRTLVLRLIRLAEGVEMD